MTSRVRNQRDLRVGGILGLPIPKCSLSKLWMHLANYADVADRGKERFLEFSLFLRLFCSAVNGYVPCTSAILL